MSDIAPPVYPPPDPTPPEQNHDHLILLNMARGGLIHSAETALRIGEVFLQEHYSKDELLRQQPLQVIDEGDRWRIAGSRNPDRKQEGLGAFHLVLWKYDGRVIDLNVPMIIHPPGWVQKRIRKSM